MFELFASLELRPHPMRLLSTAGPSLAWISRILIFRMHQNRGRLDTNGLVQKIAWAAALAPPK